MEVNSIPVTMKVGVVGVGSMGKNHARIYSEIANLVGVVDTNEKDGKALAKRLNTEYYPDHNELIKAGAEAVTIATPTVLHSSISKDFIDAGIHVLVEKPISPTVQESRELVDLAKAKGVVLAVGMVERHNPVVEFAKKAIENGEYGKVITATARRVSSFPDRIKDVGVILDLGIHDMDVMRHLVGSEVVSVFCSGGKYKHEFEDYANILLDFENGVSGFIEVNWLTPMKVRKLNLTCTKNFVELDYPSQSVEISSSTLREYDPFNLYRSHYEFDSRQVRLKKQEPLKRELADFLEPISKKKAPLVTGEDAVMSLRAALAAVESQKTGNRIDIS
jgi:UDP-N-acetylglucosamine 3-dehydrogenase